MSDLLTVRDVTKRFGDRLALNGVSFSVQRREVLGLIGPDGAGKTTLFECLAGIMTSKGERKRMLLALGLLTPHELLLLDEPFDGLDLRQTRDVMTLLKEHTANGRTLMLSIHQLVDAGRVCDRLVLLSAGTVVGEGTIPELRAQANLPDGGVEEIFLALT